MIYEIRLWLEAIFQGWGLTPGWDTRLAQITLVTSILLLSLLLTYIGRKTCVPLILTFVKRTSVKWDDFLINRPVLHALFQILPSLLVYSLVPLCFDSHEGTTFLLIFRMTQVYIAYSAILLITAFLKNLTRVAGKNPGLHHFIGVLQFLRLLVFFLGGIVMLAYLFGYNPLRVIAGLGAAATVLMLVFKDSILGLVAGIQLSMNKMLKVGDWVTIDKLSINGIVEELSLTTVKIRNFDNTISTVPPYTLVSDSFQNWNAMYTKGTRSIRKTIYIDVRTVTFASKQLTDFVTAKYGFTAAAHSHSITNLTLFRHFIMSYLQKDERISKEPWILARQLDGTPNGLPVELWFYSCNTDFVPFEEQASQYMEYFLASMADFGLRTFQLPSGTDFSLSALAGK
ncbi:mechanosensitive ion channel family protein [bacterium]|nr:mechanosensitive ion channel family protein [bacterium]